MFVACVHLKVAGRQVKPGEEVPEASHWQEAVKRAHLNMGWIEEKNGEPVRHHHSEPVRTEAVPTEGAASVANSKKKKSKNKNQT